MAAKDDGGKWLLRHYPASLVRLVTSREVVSARQLGADLVVPRKTPDGLLEVQFADRDRPETVLLELYLQPDQRIPRLVADAMLAAYLDTGVLPIGLVALLRRRGNVRPASRIRVAASRGPSRLLLSWETVNLWERPAEEALAFGDPGMIPWTTLMRYAGDPAALFERCRQVIDTAPPDDRRPLAALTELFGSVLFDGALARRILEGRTMLDLMDFPLTQEIVRLARADEAAKVAAAVSAATNREAIRSILAARLGDVPPVVVDRLNGIGDKARLDRLLKVAAVCEDLSAFEKALGRRRGR